MIPVLILAMALQAAAPPPLPPPPPAPPGPAPPAAAPGPAAPPPPSIAQPPAGAVPRRIDDLSRPLTGAVPQGSYEAGVRGAFSRTQSLQGPLDGTWLLREASGANLYRVQLVDGGFGGGLEGVWSDAKVAAGPGANGGFLTTVAREGDHLTLTFSPAGAGPATASLERRPTGVYAGDLKTADGRTVPVILVRP